MQQSLKMVAVVLGALGLVGGVWAAGSHEGGHDEQPHQGHTDHHQHDQWIDPPAEYAGKISHKWADLEAIARGAQIYEQQCASCHGGNGVGTGALASALAHPPADLTNNFHTSPGNGDAYLFWRVSEGGTVEPFLSQGSAMPAFRTILSEDERWDVLAYVHIFFHEGLAKWSTEPSMHKVGNQGMTHDEDMAHDQGKKHGHGS